MEIFSSSWLGAAYAGRTGMMPAILADEIEAGLLSKDPAVQVDAARRFALIEEQVPAPCPEGVFTFVRGSSSGSTARAWTLRAPWN